MQNAALYIFPTIYTVSYPDMVAAICRRIVHENSSLYNINILFENDHAIDYSYCGYCPKTDYHSLKMVLSSITNNSSSLTERSLFSNLSECVVTQPVFLIGIHIQQVRTLQRIVPYKYLSNIKEILTYDPKTREFIKVDIFDDLKPNNSEQLVFHEINESDFNNITKGESVVAFNIDKRAQSNVYIPKSGDSDYIYKALIGSYSKLWIEKLLSLQEVIHFLDTKKIIHALPSVMIHNNNIILLKERYIKGLYLYTMISYNGLCENIFDDDKEDQQRIKLAKYLNEIGKAIQFYHFLGIYISDIKEDNFVLQNGIVIPIDADGFSFFDYPSSQPILNYRRSDRIDNEYSYHQDSICERYSLSILMYKILFSNNMPVYEDDPKHSISYWIRLHYKDNLSEKNKNSIRMWNALPLYIQEVFQFEFCNSRKKLDYFDCDEWYLILSRYISDLKLPNSVMTYLNYANESFPSCMNYFPAEYSYRTNVERLKRWLGALNAIASALIIIAVIYIIVNQYLGG